MICIVWWNACASFTRLDPIRGSQFNLSQNLWKINCLPRGNNVPHCEVDNPSSTSRRLRFVAIIMQTNIGSGMWNYPLWLHLQIIRRLILEHEVSLGDETVTKISSYWTLPMQRTFHRFIRDSTMFHYILVIIGWRRFQAEYNLLHLRHNFRQLKVWGDL